MDGSSKHISLLDWLQRLLLIAASISGVLVVAGYMVVNGAFALHKLHMPLYDVSVIQYIAAGIYFLFQLLVTTAVLMFMAWYLVKNLFYYESLSQVMDTYLPGWWSVIIMGLGFVVLFLPNRTFGEALFISLGAIFLFFVLGRILVLIISKTAPPVSKWLVEKNIKFPPIGRLITAIRQKISQIAPGWRKYLFVALPFSFIYSLGVCVTSYTTIAPALGGGKPVCVNLVFKDPTSVGVLDFTPHPSIPRRTDKVSILAITNDGLLVLDEGKGRAVEVKNELLDGYVSCDPLDNYPTSTPIPTATPSGTAAATQNPTAAPSATQHTTVTP